jgi:DNA mismatch repair protein MutS2
MPPELSVSHPDLLSFEPCVRVDLPELRQDLAFAFAGGVVSGGLTRHRVTPPTSGWDPSCFASEIFLDDLVATCFRVRIDGHDYAVARSHLSTILAHPPDDVRSLELRRGVLSELGASTELRRAFELTYVAIHRLRSALEAAPIGVRGDVVRRRMEVLALAKEAFDSLGAFAEASSGLRRLHTFAERVKASDGYLRLSELLAYDDHLSTLDLRVRVGSDGHVRGLALVALRENVDNRYHVSPLRRWLARLAMLLRGYRVSEGEVVARIVDAVFEGIEPELLSLLQVASDFEIFLGAISLRDRARAAGLEMSMPDLVEPGDVRPRELIGLFNPLLLAHGTRPVPCDLTLERHDLTLVLTGPNSGGKTRVMQSIALAQVLGQAGLWVPARKATLRTAPALLVSMNPESAADQSEGRLGMELLRIRALFERLRPGAMVVLDELCTGTNPSEGEEIFEMVVSLLAELRPQAFVSTHFLRLTERLEHEHAVDGLCYHQVELDSNELPTFQFVPGVARTSLARRAAARLGVTREELRALARRGAQGLGPKRPEPVAEPSTSGILVRPLSRAARRARSSS